MHCDEVRQQLQQVQANGLTPLSAELQSHLTDCPECREFAADAQYRHLLRNLPAPAPREGFAEQALEAAWEAREGRRTTPSSGIGWALATAAALVLAVGVVWRIPGPGPATTGTENVQVVQVAPQSVRQVDLLMVSATALPEARITLRMGENVFLEGYPDHDNIRWTTAIAEGNNQLTLPVQLRGDRDGNIVVEVESDGARKQMVLTVEAATTSGQQVAMI